LTTTTRAPVEPNLALCAAPAGIVTAEARSSDIVRLGKDFSMFPSSTIATYGSSGSNVPWAWFGGNRSSLIVNPSTSARVTETLSSSTTVAKPVLMFPRTWRSEQKLDRTSIRGLVL
jgi:hypothetical protein